MRVLLSAFDCEPGRGSEAGLGWNWSLHLARAGHDVWTLTRAAGKAATSAYLARHPMPNLHVVHVDVPASVKPYLAHRRDEHLEYLVWQYSVYDVARTLDQLHDFEIVHHVSWCSLTGGSWLWRLHKPFVFGPVGGGQMAPSPFKRYFVEGWRTEAARSFITRWLLPLSLSKRRMLHEAACVLVSNRDTLELALRMGARNVELYSDPGLPASFFASDPVPDLLGSAEGDGAPPSTSRTPLADLTTPAPETPLRVLWVGRMFPRKGLPLTLEALSNVTVPFRLTILGDGRLAPHLPAWLDRYHLADRTDWPGRVPWETVREAYRSHDVFLFTSLRDTCAAQLLEAMACGLPIVTLDLHGAHDLVPSTAGIKVPVTTPAETVAALARALETLYHDPARRRSMSLAGPAAARLHEWSRKAAYMTRVYHSAARRHRSPHPSTQPAPRHAPLAS